MKKIAVIIPIGYRGGTFRGAKLLTEAIYLGAQQAGENVQIIFAHLNLPELYPPEDLEDLPPEIKIRPYQWTIINKKTASLAMLYAGGDLVSPEDQYQVPDDGMRYFTDCDLLVFASDRLKFSLLPITPYVNMVYDYIQCHEKLLDKYAIKQYKKVVHEAKKVFVTTEFTRNDAIEFAGLPSERVVKCPMLIPDFSMLKRDAEKLSSGYFIWTSNLALHKNHIKAFEALIEYYEKNDGQLKCVVTGVETHNLLSMSQYKILSEMIEVHPRLKQMIEIVGELPDIEYRSKLAASAFLFHPARIDNGTFSVVEAAYLGVPSLSSEYPAMVEMNRNFNLNLLFMNPHDPINMAAKLKQMESEYLERIKLIPSRDDLLKHSVENQAVHYWNAIKDCL